MPKAKLPLRNELRIFSISLKNVRQIRERKNKMKRNEKINKKVNQLDFKKF